MRAPVEPILAAQKAGIGLFVRTLGLARATTKIGLADLVADMRRLLGPERRAAVAS